MQRPEKPPQDPELRRRVQELIAYKGGGFNEDLVADVIENGLKLLKDVEARGDVRVIQTAIRELRYAYKMFAPHAHVRKVTMFGSARVRERDLLKNPTAGTRTSSCSTVRTPAP